MRFDFLEALNVQRACSGLFLSRKMAFGLSGAPFTLSAALNVVLKDCRDFGCAYYDDILVHSDNIENHLEHLRQLLSKLAEYGLQINYGKCGFVQKKVNFVGLEVTADGIRP